MKKTFYLIFILATLLSSNALMAYTVGVEEVNNYPYYSFKDKEYMGIGRDVIDQFAKHKKNTMNYKILPVERLFRSFLSPKSQLDFKYPDNPLWRQELKKDVKIYYSIPIANYIDGVLVKPDLVGQPVDKIKKLVTIRGFTPYSFLDRIKAGKVTVKKEKVMENVIRSVLQGYADGAYLNVEVAKHIMKTKYKNQKLLVFDPGLPHDKGGYQVSSTKHKELIDQLNNFLKSKDIRNNVLKKYGIKAQFKK